MRKVTNIFGKLNIANKLEEQYKLTNELVDYHLKNYSSNNNNIKNVTDILKSVLPVYPKIIFNILNTCDWYLDALQLMELKLVHFSTFWKRLKIWKLRNKLLRILL